MTTPKSHAVSVMATNRATGLVVKASSVAECARVTGINYGLLRVTRSEGRSYASGWDLVWGV